MVRRATATADELANAELVTGGRRLRAKVRRYSPRFLAVLFLFFWALATRQGRSLLALLFGPAAAVFLALSLPWVWLAEQRVPGFLHFFFIREHFQRFATPIANRPGPIYYFVVVFVAGFLPALGFFFRGLRSDRIIRVCPRQHRQQGRGVSDGPAHRPGCILAVSNRYHART